MGWWPEPPDPEYSVHECPACFGAGETPLQFVIFFGNLMPCPGQEWGFRGPPPWSFLCLQKPGEWCTWIGGDIDGWNVRYTAKTVGPFSLLHLRYGFDAGFAGEDVPCTRIFWNQGVCPFNLVRGGFAIAVPRTRKPDFSLPGIALAAGFPVDQETKMDITPIDLDYFVVHFYRKGLVKDLRVKMAIADF